MAKATTFRKNNAKKAASQSMLRDYGNSLKNGKIAALASGSSSIGA